MCATHVLSMIFISAMANKKKHQELLRGLTRPQLYKLCFEMQMIITHLKKYMYDEYSMSEGSVSLIQNGGFKKKQQSSLLDLESKTVVDDPKPKEMEPDNSMNSDFSEDAVKNQLAFEVWSIVNDVQSGKKPY